MLAVNYSTIRNNLKGYCDQALGAPKDIAEVINYIKDGGIEVQEVVA
jgi:hypothetical protein